jgi:MFS family permease
LGVSVGAKSSGILKWQKAWFPLVLLSYEIAVYLSNDMYLPALPDIAHQFKASVAQVQYTLTAWFLGSCTVPLLLGPIVDFLGRKRILVLGNAFFVVTCIGCALTQDILTMTVVRFLQGMCVSVVFIAGYAAIHDWFSGKKAVQILAWMGSITILAPSLGVYLGAWIVHYYYWQMTFWLLSGWGLISCIALIYVMPTVPRTPDFSLKRALLNYGAILKTPQFLKFTSAAFFCFMPIFAWLVAGPFVVMQTYHASALVYGLLQACVFVGYMLGMYCTKKMIVLWHVKRVILVGWLVSFVSLGVLFVLMWFNCLWWWVLGSLAGVFFGIAMLSGPFNRLAIESCAQPTAQKVAIYSNSIGFAAVLGSYLVTLFCTKQSLLELALFILVALLLGCCLFYGIPGKISLREEKADLMGAPEL